MFVRRLVPFAVVCLALLAFVSTASARVVECGEVLTEDTTLDNDLYCGTPDEALPYPALEIGAPGITVDLNGHEVWVVPDEGTALRNVGHDDVTIENGRIGGSVFLVTGVRLAQVERNVLRNLTVQGYAVFVATETADLRLSHVRLRGWTGSFVSGVNADLNDLDADGELVVRGNGHRIRSVSSSGEPLSVTGDGNRVDRVSGAHLGVYGSGNTIVGNETPILGIGGNRNLVATNVAREIHLAPAARTNTLVGNTATGGGHYSDGIYVPADALGNTLRGNVAYGNSDDGIHVDAPGTALADNRAYENGDLGIEAVPGVIDDGGNRAWDNGNPLQCLNVECGR
jgi:parallel beta-helix repeat protein